MTYVGSCSFILLSSGCVQTIAVTTVGGIADDGFSAFTEEDDLDFAEKALPGNIKLLEVMLKNNPDNTRLLLLLSQGYSSYALGFLEDKDPDRARAFICAAEIMACAFSARIRISQRRSRDP